MMFIENLEDNEESFLETIYVISIKYVGSYIRLKFIVIKIFMIAVSLY